MDVTRIPRDLLLDELAFIKLPRGKKGGKYNEKGWNRDANYEWTDETLADHLAAGGNYGLFPRAGSTICVLDVDNFHVARESGLLADLMGATFTVESGSYTPACPKLHYYFRTTAPLEGVYRISVNGEKCADLYCQFPGQARGYVVGPNSYNEETGQFYEILDPYALRVIDVDAFKARLAALTVRATKPKVTALDTTTAAEARVKGGHGLLSETLGLRVSMFLMPTKGRHRDGEFEGAHPVHGSATGSNLTITDEMWYCRRCGTGGGPLEAFAVSERLIDCADVKPGCLKGRLWKDVCALLIERGYAVRRTA